MLRVESVESFFSQFLSCIDSCSNQTIMNISRNIWNSKTRKLGMNNQTVGVLNRHSGFFPTCLGSLSVAVYVFIGAVVPDVIFNKVLCSLNR
jgi:hypothetical protein